MSKRDRSIDRFEDRHAGTGTPYGRVDASTLSELAQLRTITPAQRAQGWRFDISGFVVTVTGLEDAPEVDFEDWRAFGEGLAKLKDGIQWLIGDWLAYGIERQYADDAYTQACDITGLSYSTLTKYVTTARAFPFFLRRKNLSFSHHSEITALPSDQAQKLLDEAERQNWSVRRMLQKVGLLDAPDTPAQRGRFVATFQRFRKDVVKLAPDLHPDERQALIEELELLIDQLRK